MGSELTAVPLDQDSQEPHESPASLALGFRRAPGRVGSATFCPLSIKLKIAIETGRQRESERARRRRRRKGATRLESPTHFWHDLLGNFPPSTSNLFSVCFQTRHISLISDGKQVRNRERKEKKLKIPGWGKDVMNPH